MARSGRCFARRSRLVAPQEGWANQQIWMGHAAVTRADTHRVAQVLARGGVGQAGVDARPFRAWIDTWEMRGARSGERRQHRAASAEGIRPRLQLHAAPRRGAPSSCCRATAGYSRKSLREQASYYYSQPHYTRAGHPDHRRQACRRHRDGLARSRVEQPAAGIRSKRMGLALAALQSRRQTDAVPDAPDRRPALRLRQMDRARRQDRTTRHRRY